MSTPTATTPIRCEDWKKNGDPCGNAAHWVIETPSGFGPRVCTAHKRLWTEDSPERAAHKIGADR